MIDASTEQGALTIAFLAHDRQVDKAGLPYLLHPIRVGASLRAYGTEAVIAGYLHDVVEDSPVRLSTLESCGASRRVVSAVESVTKRKPERGTEAYAESVARAMADPLGRFVKAADILDNFGRLDGLPDGETRTRLFRKYLAVEPLVAAAVPGFRLLGPMPEPPPGWLGT